MKIVDLVNNLNSGKVNLSPVFQRGTVWGISARKKLIQNILMRRPIPAIFVYKTASGGTYSYNILDGKQRIESLILFIGSKKTDLRLANPHSYIKDAVHRRYFGFSVEYQDQMRAFHELPNENVRDFSEYEIPIIEIELDDNEGQNAVDDIVSLFVDINQQGVKVTKFEILKALNGNNSFLKQILALVAEERKNRGKGISYRICKTDFAKVLQHLSSVKKKEDTVSRVHVMWERLLEVALFVETLKHRAPAEVLRGFISGKFQEGSTEIKKLSKAKLRSLRNAFAFLRKMYSNRTVAESNLAKDVTHFYSLATLLSSTDILETVAPKDLEKRVVDWASALDGKAKSLNPAQRGFLKEYLSHAEKRTTHTQQRIERQRHLEAFLRNS